MELIQKKWNVIGLMSGTSLDGLDIVYVQILKSNEKYEFNIIFSETVPYATKWEDKLRNAFVSSEVEVNKLNIDYGNYLGEAVNRFIKKNAILDVDFVSSHGHTVFHKPNEGYTLQIGDGQVLSNKTGLKVICDFRTQDVDFGGQGAPLVPIGDQLFFSDYKYCLNLGGFANISFEDKSERIAYDICPANIVLNYFTKIEGFSFDDEGKIASSGNIKDELLQELNSLPFYRASIPKSLGFEFVKETVLPIIQKYNLGVADILRTFVEHIVIQISKKLDNKSTSKVLITGGGVFNTFLINELKKKTKTKIIVPSAEIIDYKEALIFALLGVLRSENKVNCLASVTGAKKNHSSGKIFLNRE